MSFEGLVETNTGRSATARDINGLVPVSAAVALDPPGAVLALAAARRPRNLAILFAGVTACLVGGITLGLPLLAAGAIGVGASAYAAMIAHDVADPRFARRVFGPLGAPLRPAVRVEDLDAVELHLAYAGILRAHEEVRTALQASRGVVDGMRDVYARCGDLVEASGRVARSGDALQRYLQTQTLPSLEAEVVKLASLAATTSDPHAASAYQHAAQARRRQVDIYCQIQGLYDRVKARLAVVTAFLATVQALVVKLHALDLEQVNDQGAAIADQIDDLRGEIDILESALENALSDRPPG